MSKGTFDSGLLALRASATAVVVPRSITDVLEAIGSRFEGLEYGILCKARYMGDGIWELGEEYVIPKQEVTSGSIKFLEVPDGFNAVIHKHPKGVKSFSGTDWEFINSDFDVSVLYVDGDVGAASIRIPIGDGYVLLETRAVQIAPAVELPDNLDELIQEKKTYPKAKWKTGGTIVRRSGKKDKSGGPFDDPDTAAEYLLQYFSAAEVVDHLVSYGYTRTEAQLAVDAALKQAEAAPVEEDPLSRLYDEWLSD